MDVGKTDIFSSLGITKLQDKFSLLLIISPVISLAALIIGAHVAVSLRNLTPTMDAADMQRMLTQRMTSRAFMAAQGHPCSATEAQEPIREFEEVLTAFRRGGLASGLKLSPLPRAAHPQLAELEAQWRAFKPGYELLTKNGGKADPVAALRRAEKLAEDSDRLLAAAQGLVTHLDLHERRLINTAVAAMGLFAAAAVAVFLLAFRLMRRSILAPLEELAAATQKLETGDLTATLTYTADDELGLLQRSFAKMCGAIKKDRSTRKITADLLALAMQDDPPDVFLKKALEVILSVPWFTVEPRGAIFLADKAARTLTLKAQRGLHDSLLKTCAQVPFGRCLCGRAAETGEVVFAQDLDDRHENSYEDIRPHGHYCVPLMSGSGLTGVLTLYLEPGHVNDRDETAQLKSIGGLLAEITEKKLAHAERRKMAEIIQQASEAVFMTETDGRITYVNMAFERMSGFTQEEALGRTPNLIKSGEHPPEYYSEMWASMREGRPWTGRIVNKKKNGELYVVRASIFPIKNSAGATTAYVTIQEDVSALADTEEQLRQPQKMEAVGRLAGGVAHDFNNILMAIDGYARFLSPALRGNAQAEGDLSEINKSVTRAAALTRQLLAFSRKQKAAFQPLDLHKTVVESGKLLKRLVGEAVSLEIAADNGAGTIKADPGQIDQVLMNLVVNAKDATPDGGRIEIKTVPHRTALPVPTPLGTMPAGEYSVVSVRDSGTGMDKETLSRIFDPFFTTKPKGKGTGLGLSIVYGILKHHNAYMTVASQPGKGSTFTAYFPVLAEAAAAPAAEAAKATQAIPAGTTVFLAEDDPPVREFMTRNLRELGADVKPFPGPEALLEAAAGYAGRIHLLITDIVMPGMDGFELAERLQRAKPGTAVVYMSGYTDPDIFKGRLEKPGMIFLQKPFPPEALAEAVARALAARGAA